MGFLDIFKKIKVTDKTDTVNKICGVYAITVFCLVIILLYNYSDVNKLKGQIILLEGKKAALEIENNSLKNTSAYMYSKAYELEKINPDASIIAYKDIMSQYPDSNEAKLAKEGIQRSEQKLAANRALENEPLNYSIGMTPDQFRDNWNAAYIKSAGVNIQELHIRDFNIKYGDTLNTATYQLSETVAILLTINKQQNTAREAVIVATPTKNEDANTLSLLTFVVLVNTVSPELTSTQRGDLIFRDLSLKDFSRSTVRGDKKYRFKLNNGAVMFMVGHIKDS